MFRSWTSFMWDAFFKKKNTSDFILFSLFTFERSFFLHKTFVGLFFKKILPNNCIHNMFWKKKIGKKNLIYQRAKKKYIYVIDVFYFLPFIYLFAIWAVMIIGTNWRKENGKCFVWKFQHIEMYTIIQKIRKFSTL